MKPVIIVHHHEITLKGNNRRHFEQRLLQNIRDHLKEFPEVKISGGFGKFLLKLPDEETSRRVGGILSKVFGLANICIGLKVEQDVKQFCLAAEKLLTGHQFSTMRVETRRSDKQFPVRSGAVSAAVGEFLVERYGARGDMKKPDETVYIEIANKEAFVYLAKAPGAGGLPSGISGKVVSLLSAGFDSPVASWRMMRRGATAIFVHFHSMPYTSQYSVDQVRELVRILTVYQLRSKLYIVPFAEIQNQIVLSSPSPYRIILYRRMMIRIAEAIAYKEHAEALVTGEAVAQVASQTLRNMRAIDEVATLPILRPLSGSDKEETMAQAVAIGTYDISKEPYDDCCSFLAPRAPETWADLEKVRAAEQALDTESFLRQALNSLSVETFVIPSLKKAEERNAVQM